MGHFSKGADPALPHAAMSPTLVQSVLYRSSEAKFRPAGTKSLVAFQSAVGPMPGFRRQRSSAHANVGCWPNPETLSDMAAKLQTQSFETTSIWERVLGLDR